MEYSEYLKSDHWQQLRRLAHEKADHHCQVCNAEDSLDVHHRTYENKGKEKLGDLTVLCRECHTKFHKGTSDEVDAGTLKKAHLSILKGGIDSTSAFLLGYFTKDEEVIVSRGEMAFVISAITRRFADMPIREEEKNDTDYWDVIDLLISKERK